MSDVPNNASTERNWSRPRHPPGPRRAPPFSFAPLIAGSIVGIAAWAALYTVGAAIFISVVPNFSSASSLLTGCVGAYGGLAASLALYLASLVASHCAGSQSLTGGAISGILMWGMSTITTVAVVFLLGSGFFASLSGPAAEIVRVGASVVGFGHLVGSGACEMARDTCSGLSPHPAQVLWAMIGLMLISLVAAIRGGIAGAAPREN